MDNIIVKPHKNRRRYALQINADGDIIIKTPQRSSKKMVDQLLQGNQDWIHKQQRKLKLQQQSLQQWTDPSIVFLHGNPFQLFETDGQLPIITNHRIHLPSTKDVSAFLNDQATLYLPERCLDIAQQMNVTIESIKLRQMKSCWGTCSKQGVITLNKALIKVPVWVSDYVMVHECAHRIHFDHSRSFWALVAQYCDQIKSAKNG